MFKDEELSQECHNCGKELGDHFSAWVDKENKAKYYCPHGDLTKPKIAGSRGYFTKAQ